MRAAVALPLLLLFATPPRRAAEPKAHRDIAYTDPKTEKQTLDVYAPAGGKSLPVVIFVHGGGWQAGDKKEVDKSAGAQLAALVYTDESYLKAEKLSLAASKGCTPVDGDTYDVPLQIETVEQKRADAYRKKDAGDVRVHPSSVEKVTAGASAVRPSFAVGSHQAHLP